MNKNHWFDEFIRGRLSLQSLQQQYHDLPGEELFIAIARLTPDQRKKLRDAVFAGALLTAIAVHEECPLVEFGCFVQRQINRVEYLRS